MRLGLMGGTFDPIHEGHIAVAEAALACGIDRVNFVPARRPPHKDRPDIADPYHRHAMAALATQGHPRMGVSAWELLREGPSWTIDTVRHFNEPGQVLVLIMGTDSLVEIESWREHREILELAGVIAYPRDGIGMAELAARLPAWLSETVRPGQGSAPEPGAIVCLGAKEQDFSSREIRRRLASGEAVTGLIDPAAEEYIKKHQVYRSAGRHDVH